MGVTIGLDSWPGWPPAQKLDVRFHRNSPLRFRQLQMFTVRTALQLWQSQAHLAVQQDAEGVWRLLQRKAVAGLNEERTRMRNE